MANVFSKLTTQGKFVHGNLDSQSIFISETGGSLLNVRVDVSDYHLLTRLLKVVQSEPVTTQEEGDA